MRQFSKQLIQQCQKIISKRSGSFVSEDQAEIYLESFARLGLAALKTFDKKDCKDKLIIKNKQHGKNNNSRQKHQDKNHC